ncbi:MFS transporter [Kordiimonas sp. SCSIO 12610]|uniref:MFS transporter n=1 Tax=Kordiimonas sp. SCSIO 12610 TaxID=2829597 RepID=UPI00210B5F75|nr:MFS transporter [Kordiimonas sp. SCSIO 12610]UTW55577.1 MFS transporter [Kordiimonas sp. SCSIO 12610]
MNLSFVRKNSRFLLFGVLISVFSSFGQTYFLGVFRPEMMREYSLDNSEFGSLYLIVTLGSAVGLTVFGHLIDQKDLTQYILSLCLAIAIVCFGFLFAGPLWAVLILMLFIRLLGQGLMSHAAMTSMSRYFDSNRGVAIAIAGLGIPIGQSAFPAFAVYLMDMMVWQNVWAIFGCIFLVVGVPSIWWTLKGHKARHRNWLERQNATETDDLGSINSSKRRDVIRDYRFYLILPALLSVPFWITMVFFFAETIASDKGWSLQQYTALYWVNAIGAVTLPILTGALVDKWGGIKLLALYPLLLALGLYVGTVATTELGIAAFMFLMGATVGVAMPVNNAMWAELYGTRYLGQIKSLSASIAVLSTALAPYLMGELLDRGHLITDLILMGVVTTLLSCALVLPVVIGNPQKT